MMCLEIIYNLLVYNGTSALREDQKFWKLFIYITYMKTFVGYPCYCIESERSVIIYKKQVVERVQWPTNEKYKRITYIGNYSILRTKMQYKL